MCVSTLQANELSNLKKYYLSGHLLLEQNQYQAAGEKLKKIVGDSTAIQDYVLFDYAQALWGDKRCDEAKEIFEKIAEDYSSSRWSEVSRVVSHSNEECPPLEIPEPIVEKIDCDTEGSDVEKADCFFKSRQYSKAKEIYKKITTRPKSHSGLQFLVRLSQSAARSQDFKTAIESNRLLILRYPKSKEAQEALRKIAFLYEDAGDYQEAIQILRQLVKKPKSEKRLFWGKIAWAQYRLGRYREAIDSYEIAIANGETPHLLYWKARSLEKVKKNKAGESPKEIYENLVRIYPGTYYAVRAVERLHHMGVTVSFKDWWTPLGEQWNQEEKRFASNTDLDKIYVLANLGLVADAEIEIRRTRQNSVDDFPLPNDPKRFVKESGGYLFHFRTPVQDPDFRLPYADFLFSEVRRHQNFVDPYLVYALMRQESRYRETVLSPVGAIGLLQIMPYTGKKLSKEAGWGVYSSSWLRDPLTNIELGVYYLKKLDSLFAGKWYAMVASYNAGEFVVSQWLKQRSGYPEEEFIEEIPYAETEDYVKKIYANWKAYQTIYK